MYHHSPPPATPAPSGSVSRRAVLVSLAAAAGLTVLRGGAPGPAAAQRPPLPAPAPGGLRPPLPAYVKRPFTGAAARPAVRGIVTRETSQSIGDESDLPVVQITQDGTGTALTVTKPDDINWGVVVNAYGEALAIQQTHDFAGQDCDLVNLRHQSTGDAIYIIHHGGKPPGYSGTPGGNTCINMLIPQFLDSFTAQREGGAPNNRTGMIGLKVEAQAPNSGVTAAQLVHWGGGPALAITSQYAGFPQGHGKAIHVSHDGTNDAVEIDHYGATPAATLKLVSFSAVEHAALDVRDGSNAHPRLSVRSTGALRLGDGHSAEDTTLERTGAGALRLSGSASANATLSLGANGDVNLARVAARRLQSDSMVMVRRALTWDFAYTAIGPSDAQFRYIMQTDGAMWWSPGDADVDTNLYRAAAHELRTDDGFTAKSLRASGDQTGQAGTLTLTNVNNVATPRGTGAGAIKFADATDRTNAGFLKVKIGTKDYFIPVFDAAEHPASAPAVQAQRGRELPRDSSGPPAPAPVRG